ncbi:MAG: sporulation protein YunB [Thermaerobacter sp.]|nr:sporulation protein YunB [Thermaerobacter sp.]
MPRLTDLRRSFDRFLKRYFVQPAHVAAWTVGGLLLLAIGSIVLLELNLDQTVIALSKIEAQQLAIRVLSTALERDLGKDNQNLFQVKVQGNQAFITPDVARINDETGKAALAIQAALKHLPNQPISIPLGQALGSKLLSAYGPMIPVTLIPYGALSIDFHESFQQAGINQTLLTVYLDTDTTVQIIVPLVSDEVHLKVQVPVAQEWLAGQVPQTVVMTGTTPSKIISIPIGSSTSSSGGTGAGK